MNVIKKQPIHVFNSCGCYIQVFDLEPGEGTVMHEHEYCHDILVISGKIKASIGDTLFYELGPGDVLKFPNGASHNFMALESSRLLSTVLEKDLR